MGTAQALHKHLLPGGKPALPLDAIVSLQWFRLEGGPLGGQPQITLDFLEKMNAPLYGAVASYNRALSTWQVNPEGVSPVETLASIALTGIAIPLALARRFGFPLHLSASRRRTLGIFFSDALPLLAANPPSLAGVIKYLLLFVPMSLGICLQCFFLIPRSLEAVLPERRWTPLVVIGASVIAVGLGFWVDQLFVTADLALIQMYLALFFALGAFLTRSLPLAYGFYVVTILVNTLSEGKYYTYPWAALVMGFLAAGLAVAANLFIQRRNSMIKPRVPETDHGIQGAITVAQYDQMQRSFRDKGWMETKALLDSGVTQGHALEIGHGPGYLGLEWLKRTANTTLTGSDISPDMRALAQWNAQAYGMTARSGYRLGNCNHLPFDDNSFDAVFTNGSLHEWAEPQAALDEIWRVLKPGGRYFISDLRRDMNFLMLGFLWLGVRPTAMRPGLLTSVGAAYTPDELRTLLARTRLKAAKVSANAIGLEFYGAK
jgi:SAM-dependent methyltransferase